MINNLSFENSNWIWHICIASVLLILIFIWKEYRRKNRPRFILRICSTIIAISTLTLIALKPLTSKVQKSSQAIILTKGFQKHQLDSLKKTNKKFVVYNYTKNTALFNDQNMPESTVILGEGLRPFDLWQLEKIQTTYLGGTEPIGITRLHYNTNNTVGNQARINGQYNSPTDGHKLILEGPGGSALDSFNFTNNTRNFQLTTNLTTAGIYLFNLIEKDSLDTILTKDPIPIIVEEQNQLKVLIINRNPTFETKYLKNYLAKNGHQVIVRSQLTKAKYKFEYFNMSQKPLIAFSQKDLEPFDLAIIDVSTLRTLSRQTINTFKTSIRENGLGLFIQPDNNFYSQKRSISDFNFNREKSTEAKIEAWPKSKITKYPFYFKNEFALQGIHESNNKTWVGYHRLGAGRIGTTLLQNTFELLLNGQTKAYNYLWAKTIKNISKKESPNNSWHSDAPFGFIDEPFNFNLRTRGNKPLVTTNEGYSIPMRRNIDVKSLWYGTTYPHNIGWKTHRVTQDSINTLHYYVSDSTHWKALITQNTINENKRYFNNKGVNKTKQSISKKTISPLWFYLVFIFSIGYLWFEPKL